MTPTRKQTIIAIALTVILSFVIVGLSYYFVDPHDFDDYEVLSDGSRIKKVELDGHLYYKDGENRLTHSASCKHSSHPENQ